MLGQHVNNFQIVGLLGEGGMGAVYEARHPVIDKRVAIKVLKPEYVVDGELVHRFFNEARATSAIHHPNIVEVIDVGRLPGGTPYIVMELLEGESLGDRLDRVERLEVPAAVEFARQAADALQAAHARGIVHRDLKPDNLFLVPDQRLEGRELVKVLDFGIAKLRGEVPGGDFTTIAGSVLGTPPYMSPEQCRGVSGEIDHRTDIYALGIILYEMLCGEPPFDAEGFGDVMFMHMSDPPPPPSACRPDVDAELERVIMRALAKRPEERFASMAELAAALSQVALPGAPSATAEPPTSDAVQAAAPEVSPAAEPPAVRESAQALPHGGDTGAPSGGIDDATTLRMASGGSLAAGAMRTRKGSGMRWLGLSVAAAGVLAAFVLFAPRWSAPVQPPSATARPSLPAPVAGTDHAVEAVVAAPAPAPDQESTRAVTPRSPVAATPVAAEAPAVASPDATDAHARSPSRRAPRTVTPMPRRSLTAPQRREGSPAARDGEFASTPDTPARPAPAGDPPDTASVRADKPLEPAPGYLSLDASPWANVSLGAKRLGTTPLMRIPLPPGKHVLTLENPELGATTSYVVEIKSGDSVSRLVGWEKR